MNPALLKEREIFKRRAIANPVIEIKKDNTSSEPTPKRKAKQASSNVSRVKDTNFNYKARSGSNANFSVLARIVTHMKKRHLEGDTHPLTLEEVLDETNQLDLGSRQRHWLTTEALLSNPKIVVTQDGKYAFKPAYNIRDRKALHRLLDKYDQRGMGGILYEDVKESLANADKALKNLGDSVIYITRPVDKKKVLFFNDKGLQFSVDEEFQKLWRSVAVDGIDEQKIEEYLQKQGITSMQDLGVKKHVPAQKRKKPTTKRPRNFKKLNEHMSNILEDYSEA